ncbi:MAG: hypothetical protein ACTHU0_04085 [Kofleriaceae bacterium]
MSSVGLAPAVAAAEAPAAGGLDFIDDARLLYRIAACGDPTSAVPAALSGGDDKRATQVAKIVDRHCKSILERVEKFRAAYFQKHRGWFDEVVPKDVPKTVVYPFGGGDLLSALVAFPDATEITTISLEQAGDPRRLRTLAPRALETSLGALRAEIGGLISVGSNTSENLSAQQRNELPGQVSSFLLGLVTAGYEPVSMHYFTLDDNGAIRYVDQAAIDAAEASRRKSLKHDWQSPNFSEAFANVEIRYRRPGDAAIRVHRHIGWNLGDDYLKQHPQVVRHLEQKGKVTLLTKGASYLLYRGDFSTIRNYMLGHLAWMLSDSTGIPPLYAKRAGMAQVTYGAYHGAFLEGAQANRADESFVELWATNPRKRLGFRFGYVDKDKQAHLVVTRPK